MASWFQRVILAALLSGFLFPSVISTVAYAQESRDERVLKDVVQPDIERREIDESDIDSEHWEMGLFTGVLSIEDFGTSDVYGFRIAFHISEDLFLEGSYAAAQAQPTTFELLSGATPLLTDEQRELSYYNLDLGLNIFPGEVYFGRRAFNTDTYFVAGAGNTLFADEELFTYNFGVGFRLYTTDWIAARFDFRNYIFTHSIFGEDKKTQNLEFQFGLTLFF